MIITSSTKIDDIPDISLVTLDQWGILTQTQQRVLCMRALNEANRLPFFTTEDVRCGGVQHNKRGLLWLHDKQNNRQYPSFQFQQRGATDVDYPETLEIIPLVMRINQEIFRTSHNPANHWTAWKWWSQPCPWIPDTFSNSHSLIPLDYVPELLVDELYDAARTAQVFA